MNILFRLQGYEFEWDDSKAKSNISKHSVTFEEAAEVFLDPFFQTGDASVDNNEQRDFIIGYNFSQKLLLVVYVERRQRNRIISARLATRAEKKNYEDS